MCSLPANSFSYLFDRYHPACVGVTIEEAKLLEHFVCSECSDDDVNRADNGFSASPEADAKVITWLWFLSLIMPSVFTSLFSSCCFLSP